MLGLGKPIPQNTSHGKTRKSRIIPAISVSIPTWQNTIDYEEGRVTLNSGYPRFVFDRHVVKLVQVCRDKFALSHEEALVMPSWTAAKDCQAFLSRLFHTPSRIVEQWIAVPSSDATCLPFSLGPKQDRLKVFIILFPREAKSQVKQFWQHTGEIITSRFAQYCLRLWNVPFMQLNSHVQVNQGFRNEYYSSDAKFHPDNQIHAHLHQSHIAHSLEHEAFVEERFGRNLHPSMGDAAKLALKNRLSRAFKTTSLEVKKEDVFLYPCGMNAIYHAHKLCVQLVPDCKTVQFGFPYIDTLKIQEKFGPGCIFLGRGDEQDYLELESLLAKGTRIAALFTEFPSNPLLKSPDVERLYAWARQYGFMMVIDDTIGNMVNTDILKYSDMVVSSLTKIFSGDSNVMGGSLVLNPGSPFYSQLKSHLQQHYQDTFWFEDAIFLERNSRSFKERILAINSSAETLCDYLMHHPKIKQIYYPKFTDHSTYSRYQRKDQDKSGFGGLFSILLHTQQDTIRFFDQLQVLKGPSLGTNFTLCCAYTMLAHYNELNWAASYGVSPHLIRVSVGLEEIDWLLRVFEQALE